MRRLWLAVPLSLVGCGNPHSSCGSDDLCFESRPVALTIPARNLASAEVDDDGNLEVISVGGVGVALRRGMGLDVVPTAILYSLPASGQGLALGDFNGDGRRDLVTALPTLAALAFLPREAGGFLAPAQVIEIGGKLSVLSAGDVNGDGMMDLVATEQDSEYLHFFVGSPKGLLMRQRLQFGEVVALALGDFDNDGAADVAAAVPSREAVELLTITPQGTLAPGEVVWRSTLPSALVVADFDEDGTLDLAGTDPLERLLWVGLGDGFLGWRERNVWNVDLEPTSILPRHGPNGLELALTGADKRTLELVDPLTGERRIATITYASTQGVVTADLDGDTVDELLYADAVLREVDGFAAEERWSQVGGVATGLMAALDLDGDEAIELIAEDLDRAELVVYAPEGGALAEIARTPAPDALLGLRPVASGDGGKHMAWWSQSEYGILSWSPDGLVETAKESITAGSITDLVSADLDGDGREDLVVVLAMVGNPALLMPEGILLQALRQPDGGLVLGDPIFSGGRVSSVVPVELDGDSRADLWIAHGDGVSVRLSGAGVVTSVNVMMDLMGAQSTDVDGDAVLDLVGCSANGVVAALGIGGGALQAVELLSKAPCDQIHTCDVDGDGAEELVLERSDLGNSLTPAEHSSLEVLKAVGGTWSSRGSIALGLQADRFAPICDTNGLSGWTSGLLGLSRVDIVPGPALHEMGTYPSGAPTIALGDLNGDGIDELVGDDGPRMMVASAGTHDGFAPARSVAQPGEGKLAELIEFDGSPGAELLVTQADLSGMITHSVWSLRGETMVSMGTLEIDDWEVIGDFDGDGRDELIAPDGSGGRVLVKPGVGNTETTFSPLGPQGFTNLREFRAADIDGDGRTDLLAAKPPNDNSPQGIVHVMRSVGDGIFEMPQSWGFVATIEQLGIGDLNRDGVTDLVGVRSEGFDVCLGGTNAGPASPCLTTLWPDVPRGRVWSAVGDIDGDGPPDVVLSATGPEGNTLHVLRGDGTGSIAISPAQTVTGAGEPKRARLRDGTIAWALLGTGQAHLIALKEAP